MEVLYHGIKTRYGYDFPLCFPHELLMSLRNIYTELAPKLTATDSVAQSIERWSTDPGTRVQFPAGGLLITSVNANYYYIYIYISFFLSFRVHAVFCYRWALLNGVCMYKTFRVLLQFPQINH